MAGENIYIPKVQQVNPNALRLEVQKKSFGHTTADLQARLASHPDFSESIAHSETPAFQRPPIQNRRNGGASVRAAFARHIS